MPASTCVWQMDQNVFVTLSIYTVEASNEDQALLMGIRIKDMINNITIIMTHHALLESYFEIQEDCLLEYQFG